MGLFSGIDRETGRPFTIFPLHIAMVEPTGAEGAPGELAAITLVSGRLIVVEGMAYDDVRLRLRNAGWGSATPERREEPQPPVEEPKSTA